MFSAACRLAATDTGNQLLATLPRDAWSRLEPDLVHVKLAQGQTLQEAGATSKHVYFPATAVVSLVSGLRDGCMAEVAVVGSEGMVGISAFMGGGGALSTGVVQTAGSAWLMPAAALAQHATGNALVMLPLLRYTQALFVQLAQTCACNRHHSLPQQLCRWLLLHQDRLAGDDLLVTHERISDLLGVRRESVTAGALNLQKSGLIRYARGHIAILDRRGLEAQSCECYAVVRSAYDKLLRGEPPLLTAPPTAGHMRPGGDRLLPRAAPSCAPLRQPVAALAPAV